MMATAMAKAYQARVKLAKLRRMFSIPRGQRVIDIGGGDGPFPRADVICEKYLTDDVERTNSLGNAGSRALVVGDVENLPFADKSFDFVYCSHILEHALDPSRAIAEITRIGRRGYAEVPSEYLELAATSMASHLWTVVKESDGTLVFREKAVPYPAPEVERVFRQVLWEKDDLYMAFYWKNYDRVFNIGVTWEGTIPHRVERLPERPSAFPKGKVDDLDAIRRALVAARAVKKRGVRAAVKSFATSRFTNPNIQTDVLSLIACPTCHRPLSRAGEEALACDACHLSYPYINGVPVLLLEHGTPVRS